MTRSARPTAIGTLRPAIVLYDEPHPLGEDISDLQMYDMRRGPDVLLIMGTSLKVHGLKRLVKDFAKVVHDKKGVVVFVNATPPSKEWDGVIDYHIEGDTDTWVERMEDEWKRVRPQDWELQDTLDSQVVRGTIAKSNAKSKGKSKQREFISLRKLTFQPHAERKSPSNYPHRRLHSNRPLPVTQMPVRRPYPPHRALLVTHLNLLLLHLYLPVSALVVEAFPQRLARRW